MDLLMLIKHIKELLNYMEINKFFLLSFIGLKNFPMSITEQSNEITKDIDVSEIENIIKMMRNSDSQLFSGFQNFNTIFDFEDLLKKVSKKFQNRYKTKNSCIYLSGAGTSGRLAHLCSRSYNKILNCKKFEYLIAGTDKALVKSQELSEDSPANGKNDLKNLSKNKENNIFIGITCGLSAPYVAGQISYGLENHWDTGVIGFNPIDMSRSTRIEELSGKSFKDILLENQDKLTILNPIVGPETITGSSRLKGGSMTKIVLDTVFTDSIELGENIILETLLEFQACKSYTYRYIEEISQMIKLGGDSLVNKGRIFYIGCDTSGMFGFLDASECPPTFGAKFNDVRGFIDKGWNILENRDGNLSHLSDDYDLSIDFFEKNVLSTLTETDIVYFLGIGNFGNEERLLSISKKIENAKKKWILISHLKKSFFYSNDEIPKTNIKEYISNIKIPYLGSTSNLLCFGEFSLKLILNMISTGSHILKGMVYGNRMINLRISNSKLYERSINIVSSIMNIDKEKSEQCILKAIYHDEKIENIKSIESHIQQAQERDLIVPIALLLGSGKIKSVNEAIDSLKDSRIRLIINKIKE